jgi:hypothetical protein
MYSQSVKIVEQRLVHPNSQKKKENKVGKRVTVTLSFEADSETYADLLDGMTEQQIIEELTQVAYANLVEYATDLPSFHDVETKVEEI